MSSPCCESSAELLSPSDASGRWRLRVDPDGLYAEYPTDPSRNWRATPSEVEKCWTPEGQPQTVSWIVRRSGREAEIWTWRCPSEEVPRVMMRTFAEIGGRRRPAPKPEQLPETTVLSRPPVPPRSNKTKQAAPPRPSTSHPPLPVVNDASQPLQAPSQAPETRPSPAASRPPQDLVHIQEMLEKVLATRTSPEKVLPTRASPQKPPPPAVARRHNPERQILVAAARAGKDPRKAESRQRQQPKFIKTLKDDVAESTSRVQELVGIPAGLPTVVRKQVRHHGEHKVPKPQPSVIRRPAAGMILIPAPAGMVWNQESGNPHLWPSPATYAQWTEAGRGSPDRQRPSQRGFLKKVFGTRKGSSGGPAGKVERPVKLRNGGIRLLLRPAQTKGTPSHVVRTRASSVTRSGSLTSQGSTSSDSGGENQPKSALKKPETQERAAEPKKNVTFSNYTTIQVMDQ